MAERFGGILVKPFGDPLTALPRFMANAAAVGVCVDAEDKERGLELLRSWGLSYVTTLYWCDVAQTRIWRRGVQEILLGTRGGLRLRKYQGRPMVWAPLAPEVRAQPPAKLYELIEHLTPGPYLRIGAWREHGIEMRNWTTAKDGAAVEALRKEMLKSA